MKREFNEVKILGDKAPTPTVLYEDRVDVFDFFADTPTEDPEMVPKAAPAPAPAAKPEPETVEVLANNVELAQKEESEPSAALDVVTQSKTTTPEVPHPPRKKNVVVRVSRPKHITESRGRLPVCSMEQEIMEVISANPVVVLCGETGSGKTTQVPQFMLEAGYGWRNSELNAAKSGMIACTQPHDV